MVDTSAVCAEFIGTMLFVLTVFSAASQNNVVTASLPIGVGLAAMVLAFGSISGGHFNPAVSTAMVATKNIDGSTYVAYLAAQFLGALVAAAWYSGTKKSTK